MVDKHNEGRGRGNKIKLVLHSVPKEKAGRVGYNKTGQEASSKAIQLDIHNHPAFFNDAINLRS
jgi:hypothetical protein